MIDKKSLRLYFIMGSTNTIEDPTYVLQQAIDGGITTFQYREKGVTAKKGFEKYKLGIELRNICLNNTIPFIVNDDIALAIKLHADGVHIGQKDESVVNVKERLPNDMSVGVSVSTVEEAVLAEQQGADYLGVGPIFKTSTKANAREPIGVKRIVEISKKIAIPIVAIGGIKRENAGDIMEAGASGISVISAISQAGNYKEAAHELEVAATRVEINNNH
ncbi:thiamine phosphate synthase [Virgibacillus necropolis]|uniref:Thiamine-phosphate synthase n=1 Tax=Virgibacillus necropolis TaxID=163877 RepID=A0A221M7D3_9BACI|nr:thiamine phosphate synthase [Virgibacillus necropolis]ASN03553.1 thiamine phosphate synthase [Virgibacillus necropolis]